MGTVRRPRSPSENRHAAHNAGVSTVADLTIEGSDDGCCDRRLFLTDNAMAYRNSADFHRVLDEHGFGHRLIRPYRPQTNGKVERYNRTLLDESAYASVFNSSNHRDRKSVV